MGLEHVFIINKVAERKYLWSCLSVCLCALSYLNRLTFDPDHYQSEISACVLY